MGMKFQDIRFDIDRLPTMPTIAAQMMEMLSKSDVSAERMAQAISKDAAVAARVLKIANSSFYSMSREVSNITTAVVILGERTLRNLVLAASMRSLNESFGPVEKMLWEDSVVCALGARFLATRFGNVDPEDAFVAGLFRHIGLVVLNNQEAGAGDFVIAILESDNTDNSHRELELFGATHAQIGAAVLECWKLSEMLSLTALHHSDCDLPQECSHPTRELTALINLAGALPGLFGIYGTTSNADLSVFPGVEILAADIEELNAYVEEFRQLFNANRSDFLT